MAKQQGIIRWIIGLAVVFFLAVPFYQMCGRGTPSPAGIAPQKDTSSSEAVQTPRRPTTAIEMLHTAVTLEDAVAAMNILPITFQNDSVLLAPASQPYVEEIASSIRRLHGGRRVEIVVSGTDVKIAEGRAKALQASLVSRGVEPASISAKGQFGNGHSQVTYRIAEQSQEANSKPSNSKPR